MICSPSFYSVVLLIYYIVPLRRPLVGLVSIVVFSLVFSVPIVLITSELSVAFPNNGGYSIWVHHQLISGGEHANRVPSRSRTFGLSISSCPSINLCSSSNTQAPLYTRNVQVTEAFGDFWGIQESYWSLASGVVDNAVYPVLLLVTLTCMERAFRTTGLWCRRP